MVRDTRRGLEAVYASSRADAEKRAAKARAFERLRSRHAALRATWTSGPSYDFWFERRVNNAAMALLTAYDRWVPALEVLLARSGGDLDAFYRACDELAALPPEERRARLEVAGSPWERGRDAACFLEARGAMTGSAEHCWRHARAGLPRHGSGFTVPGPGLAIRTAKHARFPAL